ncbi:hypothetical protein BH11PSE12_BH11PSE12_32790 [soil metagenome]
MKLAFKSRHTPLCIMFVSTLAAAAWVGKNNDAPTSLNISDARHPGAALANPHAQLELLPADRMQTETLALRMDLELKQAPMAQAEEVEQNIFAAKSWYVAPPPPKPLPPAPPPIPTAPPLPFIFMGLFQEEGERVTIYLAKGDRAYSVSEGDVIDNLYRVESATTKQLVLVYLPLSIKQTLSTGTGS